MCKMISEVRSTNYKRFSALNRLMHLARHLYTWFYFFILPASIVQSLCDDVLVLTWDLFIIPSPLSTLEVHVVPITSWTL